MDHKKARKYQLHYCEVRGDVPRTPLGTNTVLEGFYRHNPDTVQQYIEGRTV